MEHRVFIGVDPRHMIGHTVCSFSLIHYASAPLQITPLVLATLPIERRGLTEFSFTRFLVPWLCGYKGWAVFMDSDIVVQDDICKLWQFGRPENAVTVAEGVPDFERAAVILFNCAHADNRALTPEFIERAEGLHTINWTKKVGTFPSRWAHCVGYAEPLADPALIHYTMGNPCWPETQDCEHADKWQNERRGALGSVSWADLMGSSTHAFRAPDGTLQPKYKARDGA